MTDYNYREEISEDLSVNIQSLHKEWQNFPDLYEKWGTRLSIALFDRDIAKDSVELISAELDADIRSSPREYGIERVSESAIKSVLVQELKYKRAKLRLNKKQKIVNRLQTALKALGSKRSALENEVRLYLGSYFSEPISDDRDFQISVDNRGTEATRPRLSLTKRRKVKK